ncbi:hypothetical protein GF325_12430, partial [Candidatus Bathyarchaeota archaeon]|nr:hypothetical protein [Candidatus Bathyarchaeota archaeon]
VELYREMRALALKMEEMVRQGRMSFASQVEVHLDANLLPVEEQIIAFKRAIEHSGHEPEMHENPGVIITGILPPPPSIAATIDAAGFTVVGNDIAALHRAHASMPNGEITSLIDYYIDFYRDHCPCPTLLHASDARIAYLEKMIEETGARGMIFLGEKFCEYEYLELPFIEELVKDRGLSLLRLEFSHDDRDGLAQHVNRIEAFAEVLQKQQEGKMDER